jgi:hypothetical protein
MPPPKDSRSVFVGVPPGELYKQNKLMDVAMQPPGVKKRQISIFDNMGEDITED